GGRLLGEFGVTCYALRGTTASGAPVAPDVVAVDPGTVPMGSEIFVSGVGMRRALDTGGDIQGHRLDIWSPSADYCRRFGVQRLAAYAVD
ncbi:MAG TPA: 3D domain-containing protein, partial [Acidimicrobiales bacterium]|nr:3D domain-containing protein [Acidimicrobiales bacterium]